MGFITRHRGGPPMQSPTTFSLSALFLLVVVAQQAFAVEATSHDPLKSYGYSPHFRRSKFTSASSWLATDPADNTTECFTQLVALYGLAIAMKNISLLTPVAARMADASAHPPSGMLGVGNVQMWGDYSACYRINDNATLLQPFELDDGTSFVPSAHYCMATLVSTTGKFAGQASAYSPRLGLCLPPSCYENATKYWLDQLLAKEAASLTFLPPNLTSSIECAKPTPWTAGAICCLVLIVLLATLVVVSTALDYWQLLNTRNPRGGAHAHEHAAVESGEGKPHELAPIATSDNQYQKMMVHVQSYDHPEKERERERAGRLGKLVVFLKRALRAFSLIANVPVIMAPNKVPAKFDKDDDSVRPLDLRSLHPIRTLSMMWVLLGHTYLFVLFGGLQNALKVPEILNRFSFYMVRNATVSVDSFFFLSGFLVVYMLNQKLDSSPFPAVQYYVHRFLRLTPSYMFVLFVLAVLASHFGEGPTWNNMQVDRDCVKWWWTNLLYINNFLPNHQTDESGGCMAWGWYLANDMQFYIVCPLFLFLLRRWRSVGIAVVTTVLLASFGITLGLCIHNNFLITNQFSDYFSAVYIKPYCRISTFLVGFALGYFMCYKENVVRNAPKVIRYLIYFFAAFFMLGSLWGSWFIKDTESVVLSSFYETFYRFTWTVGLALLTANLTTGHGGLLHKVMVHDAWAPLARLTYLCYLIHPVVLLVNLDNALIPCYISDIGLVYTYLGNVFITYCFAFVCTLLVEVPCANLEKLLM